MLLEQVKNHQRRSVERSFKAKQVFGLVNERTRRLIQVEVRQLLQLIKKEKFK